MSRRQAQIVWYLLGGLLLILAGVVALYGVAFPLALGITLIIAGIVIVVASVTKAKGYAPSHPSLAVFLLGLIVFGVASSGSALFVPAKMVQTYEITSKQVDVTELDLLCSAATGNIHLSFTSNETIICKAIFTWIYSPWLQRPDIRFTETSRDKHSYIIASTTIADVDLIIGTRLKSSFNLTTTIGNIYVDAPYNAKVENLVSATTTGNIEIQASSVEHLQHLQATTTIGNAKLSIGTSSLEKNLGIQVATTTGNIDLDLSINRNIGCDLTASTNLGNIRATLQGFIILEKTDRHLHIEAVNYNQTERRVAVTIRTSLGNINVDAKA